VTGRTACRHHQSCNPHEVRAVHCILPTSISVKTSDSLGITTGSDPAKQWLLTI
jgi:hypothetical protein